MNAICYIVPSERFSMAQISILVVSTIRRFLHDSAILCIHFLFPISFPYLSLVTLITRSYFPLLMKGKWTTFLVESFAGRKVIPNKSCHFTYQIPKLHPNYPKICTKIKKMRKKVFPTIVSTNKVDCNNEMSLSVFLRHRNHLGSKRASFY